MLTCYGTRIFFFGTCGGAPALDAHCSWPYDKIYRQLNFNARSERRCSPAFKFNAHPENENELVYKTIYYKCAEDK